MIKGQASSKLGFKLGQELVNFELMRNTFPQVWRRKDVLALSSFHTSSSDILDDCLYLAGFMNLGHWAFSTLPFLIVKSILSELQFHYQQEKFWGNLAFELSHQCCFSSPVVGFESHVNCELPWAKCLSDWLLMSNVSGFSPEGRLKWKVEWCLIKRVLPRRVVAVKGTVVFD